MDEKELLQTIAAIKADLNELDRISDQMKAIAIRWERDDYYRVDSLSNGLINDLLYLRDELCEKRGE